MKKIVPKVPSITNMPSHAEALVSKLRESTTPSDANPTSSNLPNIAAATSKSITNNEDILKLFPDTNLAIQIVTSSILSPNDMLTANVLTYNLANDLKIPGEVKQLLTDTVKKHIDEHYDLNDKLNTIIKEGMFTKGAYIEAVIPEATLDDLINPAVKDGVVSTESIDHSFGSSKDCKFGFIDPIERVTELSLESAQNFAHMTIDNTKTQKHTTEFIASDLGIAITDNPTILNIQSLKEKFVSQRATAGYHHNTIATEDDVDLSSYFKSGQMASEDKGEYVQAKTEDELLRHSVGKPLILKLPTQSVIPVHVKSSPERHLGYFVLLNNHGVPIDTQADLNVSEEDMTNTMHDNKLKIISKAKEALTGIVKENLTLKNLEAMYSEIVERMLKNSLANGSYSDLADLQNNAEIYRVMLYRAMQARDTKILFLPSEVVNYYAFDYRKNGTGCSLLEKVGMLYSMRSILLFSRLMAEVKNSTTNTEVSATLDNADPDPEKTMHRIMQEALKTRQGSLPIGMSKIDDLVDWVHNSGFSFKFKHSSLPDMEIESTDSTPSKALPDMALGETVEEMIVASFGLTMEIVKSGYREDFATTVVSKNLLFAKRVIAWQNTLCGMISSHVRCYIKGDMMLQDKLTAIITEHSSQILKKINHGIKDKAKQVTIKQLNSYLVREYCNNMTVSLPKPELSEAQAMKDAFENYKSTIDDYLELLISEDSLPADIMGDISYSLDSVRSIIKVILIKNFMSTNGYLPELHQLLILDNDGTPVSNALNDFAEYSKGLSDVILPFLKNNQSLVNKIDKKINKILDGEVDDSKDDDSNNEPEGTPEVTDPINEGDIEK